MKLGRAFSDSLILERKTAGRFTKDSSSNWWLGSGRALIFSSIFFLAIFALVSLSTTLDLPSSNLFLSLPIPFLSTSIANRILFLPAFCIATLAAFGMHQWLVLKDRRIFRVIAGFGGLYLLLIVATYFIKENNYNWFEHAKFYSENNVVISLRNLVIPAGVFAVSAFLIVWGTLVQRFRFICSGLILAFAFLNIFYFSKKYFSFSEEKYLFPQLAAVKFVQENQGVYRSWNVGNAAKLSGG